MRFVHSLWLGFGLAIVLLVAATAPASAQVVLTFEGLRNLEPVLNYYNGGLGGFGSGPGPNYGITFGADALALIDLDAGGTGNFGGEPSPDTIVFFRSGPGVVMNVPAGFSTGFSFYYTAPLYTGTVEIYDGLNATGTLLASIPLPLTPYNGAPDPTGNFSPLVPFGVSFSGVARSVNFGGVADYIGFDNITLGSQTPGGAIPEPTTLVLFAGGLGAVLGARRRTR